MINFCNLTDLKKIDSWLKSTVPDNTKIVLPFSGGLDSSTITALLAKVLGSNKIIAVHVSYSSTHPEEAQNANEIA